MRTCQWHPLLSLLCYLLLALTLLNMGKRCQRHYSSPPSLSFSLTHTHIHLPKSTFSLWALYLEMSVEVFRGEGRGRVNVVGEWGLSERCTHQTWGGFHFCVKSRYQTGAGYANWEKKASRGGAERSCSSRGRLYILALKFNILKSSNFMLMNYY